MLRAITIEGRGIFTPQFRAEQVCAQARMDAPSLRRCEAARLHGVVGGRRFRGPHPYKASPARAGAGLKVVYDFSFIRT